MSTEEGLVLVAIDRSLKKKTENDCSIQRVRTLHIGVPRGLEQPTGGAAGGLVHVTVDPGANHVHTPLLPVSEWTLCHREQIRTVIKRSL